MPNKNIDSYAGLENKDVGNNVLPAYFAGKLLARQNQTGHVLCAHYT